MTPAGSAPITFTPSGFLEPVILDCGCTLSYLPNDLILTMLAMFTGWADAGGGQYTIPCSYMTDTVSTIDLGFPGTTIKVPFHQFLWLEVETGLFWFGISDNRGLGLSILGGTLLSQGLISKCSRYTPYLDTFLRSAYGESLSKFRHWKSY